MNTPLICLAILLAILLHVCECYRYYRKGFEEGDRVYEDEHVVVVVNGVSKWMRKEDAEAMKRGEMAEFYKPLLEKCFPDKIPNADDGVEVKWKKNGEETEHGN